jgi:Flp pilus assembly protein TadD
MKALHLATAAALVALMAFVPPATAKSRQGAPVAPAASKSNLDKLQAQPASRKAAREYQKAKFREAADDFKEALEVNPKNFRAAYLLGMSYLNRERWEDARDAFRLALELGADRMTQAHIYNGLAYSYEAIHQTRMAHHYYHFACHAHKANTYAQQGAKRTEYRDRSEPKPKEVAKIGTASRRNSG